MTNEKAGEFCLICVDAGTTNTRVWLTVGERVVARAQAGVGVRDTARDGSSERLRNALRELINRVQNDARDQGFAQSPECLIAAGSVTPPPRLVEVPPRTTPARLDEAARPPRQHNLPKHTH